MCHGSPESLEIIVFFFLYPPQVGRSFTPVLQFEHRFEAEAPRRLTGNCRSVT